MHFINLDAYFHLASQGDTEAYKILYLEFVRKAKIITKATLKNPSNFPVIPEDFSDFIDVLFFRAINEYDGERGSFSWYVDYVISVRLEKRIKKAIAENPIDYDFCDLDFLQESDCIDLLADPNQKPIVEDVAVSSFKYRLASPKEHRTRKEKMRDKIILLQYAGFKNTEIAKKLNLTINEFRGYLKGIKKDDKIVNLKLDLK